MPVHPFQSPAFAWKLALTSWRDSGEVAYLTQLIRGGIQIPKELRKEVADALEHPERRGVLPNHRPQEWYTMKSAIGDLAINYRELLRAARRKHKKGDARKKLTIESRWPEPEALSYIKGTPGTDALDRATLAVLRKSFSSVTGAGPEGKHLIAITMDDVREPRKYRNTRTHNKPGLEN